MNPSVCLLVTAGGGPEECNMAVAHVLDRMATEAATTGLECSAHETKGRHGPKSAVVLLHGANAQALADAWVGTIQWRMNSPLRPQHKRSNWFVGVFALARPSVGSRQIAPGDVTYSTLRAGGPGGQHQNTTDSAVRATHVPTGITVVVRDGRSQHRNKALALTRLQTLAEARDTAEAEQQKSALYQHHAALARGNPKRCFQGARFKEV